MRPFAKFAIMTLTLTLLSACVTKKSKTEAKGVRLFFHNLTAHYNGYFNAKELMKESQEKLLAQHKENFNEILDVYPEVAVENPQAAASEMDKAIEKVAVVATFHRPSHWADDCYLLLGKAQHLKHDFQAAEESFAYLTEVYDPLKKRKLTSKEKKELAEERRKDKIREREEITKRLREEREEEARQRKEEKEQANKAREEKLKQEQDELKKRNEEKQKTTQDAAKGRKEKQLTAKEALDKRNQERRDAAEARRRENAEKRKNPPVEKPEPDTRITNQPPRTQPKVEVSKTGSNSTPVFKVEEKKYKGKKGRPDRYFLKHRPCHQEGLVWLARTYTMRQSYADAEVILDEVEKNPKTFKDIRAQAAVARVDMYMKQKNYEAAIPALENALKVNKKKKVKARLAFILAQLYQKAGNVERAYASFDKVLDYAPVYEMEFNARLNMAVTSSKSTENTTAILKKMARDFKNREYGDQIYYALAQISLKNGARTEGVEYMKKALNSGGTNPKQKAENYYLMAKLQFESEDYVASKRYYDSTLSVMPQTDKRYAEVERYSKNLTGIAQNLELVRLKDSLLVIAAMPKEEQRKLALKIKKDRAEKIRQANLASNLASNGGNSSNLSDPSVSSNKKSKFFGYNADAVKKGKKDFEKKWGNERKLEDNWRRINKKGVGGDSKFAEETQLDGITDKEVSEILKEVPKSVADITAAKTQIEEGMFQLGTLYYDNLHNEKKCAETLEKHLERFVTTAHEHEDFYYLYRAYNDLNEKVKAQAYFDKLQSKHPNTSYAQLLKNPGDFKKADEQTVEKYYENTYNSFRKGEYQTVSQRVSASDATFGVNNPFKAKFALLNAMTIGQMKGKPDYIIALKEVVTKFDGTPEQKRAEEMVRILESNQMQNMQLQIDQEKRKKADEETLFKADMAQTHYAMVIFEKGADIEDAKAVVSDFNAKFYRLEDLKLTSIYLSPDSEIPMLIVRRFDNAASAKAYMDVTNVNKAFFVKKSKFEIFAVSQDNYRQIIKLKSFDEYKTFYEQNYKK